MSKHDDDGKPAAGESEFERAGKQRQLSIVEELLAFVVENRKWALIPILVVLGLAGVLAILAATGVAPLIYPFF